MFIFLIFFFLSVIVIFHHVCHGVLIKIFISYILCFSMSLKISLSFDLTVLRCCVVIQCMNPSCRSNLYRQPLIDMAGTAPMVLNGHSISSPRHSPAQKSPLPSQFYGQHLSKQLPREKNNCQWQRFILLPREWSCEHLDLGGHELPSMPFERQTSNCSFKYGQQSVWDMHITGKLWLPSVDFVCYQLNIADCKKWHLTFIMWKEGC